LGGGFAGKFGGFGFCKSTIVTLMALCVPEPVAADGVSMVKRSERGVASGLLFGHSSQIPAVPGGQSASVAQGSCILAPDAQDLAGAQTGPAGTTAEAQAQVHSPTGSPGGRHAPPSQSSRSKARLHVPAETAVQSASASHGTRSHVPGAQSKSTVQVVVGALLHFLTVHAPNSHSSWLVNASKMLLPQNAGGQVQSASQRPGHG